MTELDPSTIGEDDTIAGLIAGRLSRRQALRAGLVATASMAALRFESAAGATPVPSPAGRPMSSPLPQVVGLSPVTETVDAVSVAGGLTSSVLVRWGDPILPGAPAFAPDAQTAAAQAQQFGFNCDYIAVTPHGDHHLLFVNHEYTTGNEMFPNYPDPATALVGDLTPFVDIELAAHGASVVKMTRANGRYTMVVDSINRRITANTPMAITGPATSIVGSTATGMLNNCAGGITPWGTVLTCEENFNQYFANVATCPDAVAKADHAVYGLPNAASERGWERVYPSRFDTAVAPQEPWKYGYVVEIDPSDPASTPKKRSALGRFKHEAANTVVAPNGRVVVYSGDDERFQYVYKFVTAGTYNASNRAANMDLLDTGELFVAKFNADGSGAWLSLKYVGNEAFWNGNGFTSQADICVRTRSAAALLGATKMDRPEDIEPSPVTGKVYLAMTNNTNRGTGANPGTDTANPRVSNKYGHVLELTESGDDHTATTFAWDIFLLCGHGETAANLVATPGAATSNESTYFGGWTGVSTIISCPDNLAFDQAGNLYIGTDGQPGTVDKCDGVFVVPTAGSYRGRLVQLVATPAGSECTGPMLSADDRTLFVAVQHPGEGGTFPAGQPAQNALSRWPDSTATGAAAIPRPSVVQIARTDGGKIAATATAKLVAQDAERVLDTRNAIGVATRTALPAGSTLALAFDLTDNELSSIAALVMTTTIVDATANGFLTVFPGSSTQPGTSTVNVDRAGQTRANLVTAAVGPDRKVQMYTSGGGHLLADVSAAYHYVAASTDGRFVPVAPTRAFDTRSGAGVSAAGKVAGNSVLSAQVLGRNGVPATGVSAVVLNVTVTEPDAAGYVTVFRGTSRPTTSSVNYSSAGQDIAAQVVAPVGTDGIVKFYSSAGTHLIADVAGYFTDATAPLSDAGLYVPVAGARVLDTRHGLGGTTGPVSTSSSFDLTVTGVAGVPTSGVAAIVGNLTVVDSTAPSGYVTVWPAGSTRPVVSNLNAKDAGQTVANQITVPVGTGGKISVFSTTGGHLLLDITGWYTS